MHKNCRWVEVVLLLLIIIWTLWNNLLGISTFWVVIVLAVILLIHEFGCKACHVKVKPKPKKRKKRK